MKKSCSLLDSSPGPFAYEAKALPLSYGGLMFAEWIKVHLVLTVLLLRNLPAAHGRCNRIICRVFLSYNICIFLLFDHLRSLLIVNSLQNVTNDILQYLPMFLRLTLHFTKDQGWWRNIRNVRMVHIANLISYEMKYVTWYISANCRDELCLTVNARTTSLPACTYSSCSALTSSGYSRTTSGTKVPAFRYPLRSNSNR